MRKRHGCCHNLVTKVWLGRGPKKVLDDRDRSVVVVARRRLGSSRRRRRRIPSRMMVDVSYGRST